MLRTSGYIGPRRSSLRYNRWVICSQLVPHRNMSDMKTPENIVIVGGGIIGACCAYYLAHHPSFDPAKTKLTLIEASEIASGASGKGFVFPVRGLPARLGFWNVGMGGVLCISGKNVVSLPTPVLEPGVVLAVFMVLVRSLSGVSGDNAELVDLFLQRRTLLDRPEWRCAISFTVLAKEKILD